MNDPASAPAGALARVCRWLELLAMLLLALMTAFLAVQAAARNLLAMGLPWAEELARYAGLGVVYLAVPLLLLHDRHIKVDVLLHKVRGSAARALHVTNELIVLAFAALMLWGGWQFLRRASQFSTAALGIPNWLYYLPAAVGMLLFALVAVQRVVRALARPHAGGAAP